jgi:tetratricopeptide (TPR) repeat protein
MLLFLLGVFYIPCSASGDYSYNQGCQAAHDQLIRLKLSKANDLINKEKHTNPDNLIPVLLEFQSSFLKAYCTGDEEAFKFFRDFKNQTVHRLENGNKLSPYYRYCLAEVYMMSAVGKIRNEDYLSAMHEVRKGFILLQENQKQFPDFLPNKKTLGMLHALVGAIPEQYIWVTKLLGIKGSLKQGVQELKEVVTKSQSDKRYTFLSSESLVMLTWTVLGLDLFKAEGKFVDSQYHNPVNKALVSESALMATGYAWYLIKQGNNDDALHLLKSLPEGGDYLQFHYIKYLTGTAVLNKADTTAARYFRYFATRHKGRNIIKSAWHRLAWIEILKDNDKGYEKYMSMVKHFGNDAGEADKLALKEAKEGKRPHKVLLKSRLLCDGGYYQQAEIALNQGLKTDKISTRKDSLECEYRYGRIYQYQGNFDKAIKFYKKAVEDGKNESWYFACNSALMLGEIYEDKSNPQLALHYYEMCLDIKPSEYRASLHMKAKAGIKRIKG